MEAEQTGDFEAIRTYCHMPDFQMDEESKEYCLRASARISVVAINHHLEVMGGKYNPAPSIDHILVDYSSSDIPAIQIKAVGRPSKTDWQATKSKLLEMERNGELPEIKHGWRTKVARALAQWHQEQFGKHDKPAGIRNNSIIRPELDRIEAVINDKSSDTS